MTSVALVIFLIVLLTVSVIGFRGSLVAPANLFIVFFTLSVINGLTNFDNWNFSLHLNTVFVIGGGALLFFIICFIVHLIAQELSPVRVVKRPLMVTATVINSLPRVVYFAGIAFSLGTALLVVKEVQGVVSQYGGSGNLIEALGRYDELVKFSTLNIGLPGFTNIVYSVGQALFYAWAYIFIRSVVLKDSAKDYLALINCIVAAFLPLLTGGRNGLIAEMIAVAVFYLMWHQRTDANLKGSFSFAKILGILAAVTVAVSLFRPLLSLLGRDSGGQKGYSYLSIYLGAPIKNLDSYLNGTLTNGIPVESKQWGDMTLSLLRSSIGRPVDYSWLDWQPFQSVNGHELGNVFTIYYPLIFDWGIPGALIAVAVIAFLSQLIFEVAQRAIVNGSLINTSILIYGTVAYGISFSFFSNRLIATILNRQFMIWIMLWGIIQFLAQTYQSFQRESKKTPVAFQIFAPFAGGGSFRNIGNTDTKEN